MNILKRIDDTRSRLASVVAEIERFAADPEMPKRYPIIYELMKDARVGEVAFDWGVSGLGFVWRQVLRAGCYAVLLKRRLIK